MGEPQEPWIEFLDDPEPPATGDAPLPARRGMRVAVGGLAGAALLGLLVVRLVHSDPAPPPAPAAVVLVHPTLDVPVAQPRACTLMNECEGLDTLETLTPQVQAAIAQHLHMSETSEASEYQAGTAPGLGRVLTRRIEANDVDAGIDIDIHRLGAYYYGGQPVIRAGDGSDIVTAQVRAHGYEIHLTAMGRHGTVPSEAALAALGNDPRLLAVAP